MAVYAAKKNSNMPPMHPGELVSEVVESLKMPVTEIAKGIGISRQHLYAIMNGKKPVTPEVATRLGAAFGNGPELWLKLQLTYDLWHAKRNVDLSKVRVLKAA